MNSNLVAGHGANLLVGVTPDFSGSLPAAHVARYAEFGEWRRSCYGLQNMLAERHNITINLQQQHNHDHVHDDSATRRQKGLPQQQHQQVAGLPGGQVGHQSIVLPLPPGSSFDRIWLMEDLSRGQKITAFTLEIQMAAPAPAPALANPNLNATTAGSIGMAGEKTGLWGTPQPWLFPCGVVGVCGGGGGGPQGGGDAPWLPTVRHVAAFNGSAIGHKRIVKLCTNQTTEEAAPVVGAVAVRLNVTRVLGDQTAVLRSFAVFSSRGCA